MVKQIVFLILLSLSASLSSQTRYRVTTTQNDVIIGNVEEDKPGSYIVIRDESGEIFVIKYENIISITVEGDKAEKTEEIEDLFIPPLFTIETESGNYSSDLFINNISGDLSGLSFRELNRYVLPDIYRDTLSAESKEEIYNRVRKDDTLKYTLLNIVPGLGSLMQGDYYAAGYTITSVLGAVLYNVANQAETDYYFLINLNGILSYAASFFAPYRFNSEYNETVKDKLSL